MRARRTLLATLALIATLAWPSLVRAAKVEDLVALATTTWKMSCTSSADDVTCLGGSRIEPWDAVITPASGHEETLQTTARDLEPPLDQLPIDWMTDLHATACGSRNGVSAFVETVGALTKEGSVPDASIGTCTFSGSYSVPVTGAQPFYTVRSKYVEPPPPTPEPTPKPTKKPPKPTPEPTPEPTPSPTPSPTPEITPSPSPIPPTAAPPTDAPTFVPTQEVAAETDVPDESAPPPAAPGPPAPPEPPTFAGSIAAVTDLNTEPVALVGSLLLALLLLLIIGFIGELFNNTVENNYDVIAGWFRKGPLGAVRRGLDRIRVDLPGSPGVLLFIALTALVSSFVDPGLRARPSVGRRLPRLPRRADRRARKLQAAAHPRPPSHDR